MVWPDLHELEVDLTKNAKNTRGKAQQQQHYRGRGTRSKHIGYSNPHTSAIHNKIHTPQEVRLVVPSPSTTRRVASPSMIGEREVGGAQSADRGSLPREMVDGDPIRRSSLSPTREGRKSRRSISLRGR